MDTITLDELEIDYGTTILAGLTGIELRRNQQPVRLFDQTKHSAEFYFRADKFGKPYIQNFQEGKRYYPVTAYSLVHQIDFNTAKKELLWQYYGVNSWATIRSRPKPIVRSPVVSPVYLLNKAYYKQCQSQFDRNGLYEYLRNRYGTEKANDVFALYHLGTSHRWKYLGYFSTAFPQFDSRGNLRQVKIMPFDAMNGRRVKKNQSAQVWNSRTHGYEPTEDDTDKIFFAGKSIAKQFGTHNPYLQQCFFGEHLLAVYSNKQVAIVEGESTAIVCSLIWPEYTWLATGGSMGGSWFSPERFQILRGREVVLWPDTGKYEEWKKKASQVSHLVKSLYVSDYVEKNTPSGLGNLDLRDLLTMPCYYPHNSDKPIYGEQLIVEPSLTYPVEWDETNPPDAKPTIRVQSIREWQSQFKD
ncbi:DUF6371 domain-containing protein [Spirosoma sp. KNUC1025]|uniref:DUF6371 domain-containing protein n=1 Tax=Spirosoma sp. KNUC1025 TaxID=2894082 RepID=UPI00386AAD97|nr:DUF6371 domain-containing protein [Spirosoma sp. KNUC1025]